MNCLLIEMGEMACYQERCPQCGRIPPGRKVLPDKKVKPPDILNKLAARNLPGPKSNTHSGEVNTEDTASINKQPHTANLPTNAQLSRIKSGYGKNRVKDGFGFIV